MALNASFAEGEPKRQTPISIVGMSGLREIIAVSTGMALIYTVAAMIIGGRPLLTLGLVFAGLLFWTFLEYILHRWMLHWEPEEKFQKAIRKCFPTHRSHHDEPMDERKNIKKQLKIIVYLMTAYSALLAVIGFPLAGVLAVNAGVLLGYQAYEYVHVACHHLPMKNAWAALLKRHHAIHHHRDETVNFGVTTTVWDSVFRTTWKPQRAPAR